MKTIFLILLRLKYKFFKFTNYMNSKNNSICAVKDFLKLSKGIKDCVEKMFLKCISFY